MDLEVRFCLILKTVFDPDTTSTPILRRDLRFGDNNGVCWCPQTILILKIRFKENRICWFVLKNRKSAHLRINELNIVFGKEYFEKLVVILFVLYL